MSYNKDKKLSSKKGAFIFYMLIFSFYAIAASTELSDITTQIQQGNLMQAEKNLRKYITQIDNADSCSNEIIIAVRKLVECQSEMNQPFIDLDSVSYNKEDKRLHQKIESKLKNYYELNETTNSIYLLNILLHLQQVTDEYYNFNLAVILYKNGCSNRSEKLFKELIDNKEYTIESSINLSWIYVDRGDFQSASAVINKAFERIKMNTENQVKLKIQLGIIHYYWWSKSNSLDHLEKAFYYLKDANTIKAEKISDRLMASNVVNLKIDFNTFSIDDIGSICGRIKIKQSWGNDCIITGIQPLVHTMTGKTIYGDVYAIEEVTELIGNPLFFRGLTRQSEDCGISIDLDTLESWSETPLNAKWANIQFKVDYLTLGGVFKEVYSSKISLTNSIKGSGEIFSRLYWASKKNYIPFFTKLMLLILESDSTFLPYSNLYDDDSTHIKLWVEYLKLRELVTDSTQIENGFKLWKREKKKFAGFPNYLLMGGVYYQLLEQYDSAAVIYSKVLEVDPGNKWAHFNMGLLCYNINDIKGAIKSFNKVIEIDSTFGLAYLSMGILYEYRVEDYKIAIDYYNKYVKYAEKLEYYVIPWIEELEERLKNSGGATQE